MNYMTRRRQTASKILTQPSLQPLRSVKGTGRQPAASGDLRPQTLLTGTVRPTERTTFHLTRPRTRSPRRCCKDPSHSTIISRRSEVAPRFLKTGGAASPETSSGKATVDTQPSQHQRQGRKC